jgi:beta-glucosidase
MVSTATPSRGSALEGTCVFIVATGIECSAPRIAGGRRRDELLLTGHRDRVEEDLDLVVGLGITHLRYGIPFHLVAADPAALDWSWTDHAMEAMRARRIEPIADLMHFGVPDDLWGIGDPRLPRRYEAYARAFAERYPWVRWYTPVNEPLITAMFSGHNGWWNERGTDDRSFVAALANAAECAVRGSMLIRERRPDALFVQSDACESFAAADPSDAASRDAALHRAEIGFLGFDLTYGVAPSLATQRWLVAQGLPEERLAWFREHGSPDGAIAGMDYYRGNERLVAASGKESPAQRRGFAAVARTFHDRYGVPLMLAETNATADAALDWLAETWNDTVALYDDRVPIVGYCWYSLTDQVDWDTCLREANGRVNSLGLVDLDRHRRPVAGLYEQLARATAASGRPEQVPAEPDVVAA